MISGVFVDRPRLAIVIAIITVIAGALAMLVIPVSQFPDIVPPQVQVTTRYPGASAAVVEATVAQPLEAQINGADQMIYMKSNSANDGSYGLTVSFALGSNPDINTVNVNNRVQAALSRLPQEVQRNGVTVQKRSSAILEFLSFSSEGAKQTPLFISNYVTINVLDRLSRVQGVGSASLFGALDYSMRIWFDTNRLIQLNLAPSDIVQAIQQQNVQAPVGRVGARPTSDDTQFQINLQTKGRLTQPEEFGAIIVRANPDGSVLRVRDVARVLRLHWWNVDDDRTLRLARRHESATTTARRGHLVLDLVVDAIGRSGPRSDVPRLATTRLARSRLPGLRTRSAPLATLAEPSLPLLDLLAHFRQFLAQRTQFATAFLVTLAKRRVLFLQLHDPLLLRRHSISDDRVDERWKELSASGPKNGRTQ